MNDRWAITITPVPKTEDCVIKTSDGQEWTVKGLALFADGGDGNLFSYFWNSPAMAAAGFVRALSESMRRGDLCAMAFYKRILGGLVKATGSHDRQTVEAEDLLRKWEAEEVYKSVQEDTKKFN